MKEKRGYYDIKEFKLSRLFVVIQLILICTFIILFPSFSYAKTTFYNNATLGSSFNYSPDGYTRIKSSSTQISIIDLTLFDSNVSNNGSYYYLNIRTTSTSTASICTSNTLNTQNAPAGRSFPFVFSNCTVTPNTFYYIFFIRSGTSWRYARFGTDYDSNLEFYDPSSGVIRPYDLSMIMTGTSSNEIIFEEPKKEENNTNNGLPEEVKYLIYSSSLLLLTAVLVLII